MMHAPWSVGTRARGLGLRRAALSLSAAGVLFLAMSLACSPDRAVIEPPANPANGACCAHAGSACTVTTQANCIGTWIQGGICVPNPCTPSTGSCCTPGGVCTVTTQSACSGTWTMSGVCVPNPCLSPSGACCVANGTCTVTTQATCAGTWIQGGVCAPNPCPQPALTGSCCASDGSCTVTTQVLCTGGTWTQGGVCSPNPCVQLPPGNFSATGLVGSFEAKEIDTISGAGLKVPLLAVPKTPAGGEGKMTFSIERDQTTTVTPPAGHTKTSDTYRFGPDGFVFERPVTLKIPVQGDTTGKSFTLYRINQTTGASEPYGGIYDRATKTISVQTYKLSPWFVAGAPQVNTAWGAIEVTNTSLDQWLNLCVEQYTVRYPEADADFHGEASSSWAPIGEIGVTNHGLWFVPQGTYRICAEMQTAGTISSPPGAPHHVLLDNIQVNTAWTHSQPVSTPLSLSGLGSGAVDGPCPCLPVPTPSVGTGDVQVTLTWHSAQPIDLDLWVTEPGGTRCYYSTPTTPTGGSLDLDNKCGNYVDGRPENIFWANAPTGEYKVEADWFSDCSSGLSSLGYDVRVINGTTVRTFSGTIAANATVEVTRFTVAAGRVAGFLPVGESAASRGPRLAKN